MTIKPKLMAFDLDGTLLDSKKQVPPSAVEALRRATEEGVTVIPCTGRPANGVLANVLPLFPKPGYAVCANGAAVVMLDSGEYLGLWALSRQKVDSVRALAAQRDMLCEFYYHGKSNVSAADFSRAGEFVYPEMREYYFASRKVCQDIDAFVEQHGSEVEKINMLFKDESARRYIMEKLKDIDGIYVTSSAKNNLEITDTASDKGRAILFLAQKLGIRQQETVAFGDSDNDLPMLRAVGVSVAMGNAAPNVKAAASMVTDSNDEDGIANAIERLLPGWESEE